MAGDPSVAMFGYLDSASSDNQGSCCRYIKGIGPIPPCPAGIEDGFLFYINFIPINVYDMVVKAYLLCPRPHCPGSPGNLIYSLPLHPECRDKRADLGRCGLAGQNLSHGHFHLFLIHIIPSYHLCNSFFYHFTFLLFLKIL